MTAKFARELWQSDDNFFHTAGDEIYASYIPSVASELANSPADQFSTTQTALASVSSSSPGAVVAETSGGITINLLFDAAAMAAPASFRAGMEQAASLLTTAISDKITVNLNIDYSGTGGGAAAGPDNGLYESYSSIRADLVNKATPGDTIFNALPSGSSVQGQSSVAVWNAQLKLFGLVGANDTSTDDGSATFATDISSNLLVGVALHELTHALGRVPYGAQPDIFDLFRFTSAGTYLLAGGNTAPAAYFSIDGGNTKLADFGQNSDPSDFLNSGVQGPNDPFNEFYTGSTSQSLTAIDKELLDALGFHTTSFVSSVIESSGSTSLVQIGSNYFLYPVGGGSGPELKYGGAPVVAGQFSSWVPIGAEQTATGYDFAWKIPGADDYTVWSTDSSGNYISNLTEIVSGSSSALETLETVFHQDLNGDGVIGPPPTVMESSGSTSLVEVGSNYFLDPVGGGSGSELKYGGAPVVVGQFSPWVPIGAEQTATGYDFAWKIPGADDYTVWSTDSSGNYISNLTEIVSGSSSALETLETVFHQDLNGDGVIGPPTTVMESSGSTSLVEVGSNYFLDPVGGGSGPELKYGGAPVVAGQFSPWVPIGAEQTATGYDFAWKIPGADDYTVWSTDSSGNYISNLTEIVSGSSSALETLETVFQQDLNGDGVIGPPTTVMESSGSTSLVQVGSNFFFDPVGGGSGPELKYGGAPVVAGQFSPWVPIGAEQTATGYDFAWKIPGADDYTVWSTDSSGNYISNLTEIVSGSSSALETLETVFHQDLNGDGVIGLAVAANATLELNAAHSQNVTFESSTGTLKLDNPATFSGQVVGFTGDGTLAGSDHIDLLNVAFSSAIQSDSTYNSSTGVLSVSNGSTVDPLDFVGSYSLANFKFAGDGTGGTIVYDPPITSHPLSTNGADKSTLVTGNSTIEGNEGLNNQVVVESGATLKLDHAAGGSTITNNGTIPVTNNSTVDLFAGAKPDNFVFAPNFGQATISNFTPGADALQIDHTTFASLGALTATIHDESHGNTVIIDAAHDTITIENVTTAQLLAHQSYVHLV